MPANSICNIAGSTYGVEHWNETCTPETDSVTITVTISGATSDNPRIDFQPAMRFSPDKNVELYMYSPSASLSDSWKLLYCNAENACVDESTTDSELQSYVDHGASVVFRRIKHFSGYLATSDFSDSSGVLVRIQLVRSILSAINDLDPTSGGARSRALPIGAHTWFAALP